MAECPQPAPPPTEIDIDLDGEENETKVNGEGTPYRRIDSNDDEEEGDHVQRRFQQAQLKRKFTSTFATPSSPSVFAATEDDDVAVEMAPVADDADIPPPSNPILLTWQDICYGIPVVDEEAKAERGRCDLRTPMKRRALLSGVSGEARPGELMVILGPSGCGKTTLMNILSGRISLKSTGNSGTIFVNGVKRNKRFKRHTSFVLQEDLFFPSLSVRQTLTLTGQLILRCDSEEEKQARIQSMISLLRLEKCQKSRVGNAVRRGLSGGEKKRLNIANELLIDPSLIFLDEPTSGLDAFLAEELLSILALLAKSGRTIVTTLHQPSSQIYKLVDKVFLMAEGGRVAYFGPASEAVAHFSRLNFRCPRFYNPADFLLDLVQHYPTLPDSFQQEVFIIVSDASDASINTFEDGSGVVGKTGGMSVEHSSSTSSSISRDGSEQRLMDDKEKKGRGNEEEEPKVLSVPGTSRKIPPPLPDRGDKWPIGWARQASLLALRSVRQHAEIAAWNIFIFLLIATIGAIVWWDRGYTYEAVGDRQGLMFFCLLQWFLFPMFGEVHSLVPEIGVITKERREGSLHLFLTFSLFFLSLSLSLLILHLRHVSFVSVCIREDSR
jgi:ABC-type multidrug transport system ATPase subunit